MPGPYETALLDDFDRADAATLGANWTADIGFNGSFESLRVVSNECAKGAGSGFQSNWWSAAAFGASQEVWTTIKTLPDGNGGNLCARISNPGTTSATFYELFFASGLPMQLVRVDGCPGGARNETFLDPDSGVNPAANDRIALACVGTSIEIWRDNGGGWTQLQAFTDGTYQSGGSIGLWAQNVTTFAVDDFGGGNIPVEIAWIRA